MDQTIISEKEDIMKLFYAPESRAVRTAWLLNELKLKFEVVKFYIGDPKMRAPEYLEKNPMGRVPILEDGNVRISESTAIAQYLVARYDNDGMLSPHPESQDFPAYLQWMHFAEGMIMPPVNTIVVETILLSPEKRNEVNLGRATKLLNRALSVLDTYLEGKDFLAGKFSAADTITGHACIVTKNLGADLSDKPNIASYRERLLERQALKDALDIKQ